MTTLFGESGYLRLLGYVANLGQDRPDRTGTGTRSVFAPPDLRFDLRDGFPLFTTKFVSIKNVAAELLWFLSGSSDVRDLQAVGCHIWDEWADSRGNLGPIYGRQWRAWPGAYNGRRDQVCAMVQALRDDPFSRRHLVSAWNVDVLPLRGVSPQENVEAGFMALAPCHFAFQCYVEEDDVQRTLNMKVSQRSADLFLGVPYNVASYALLTHMLAQQIDAEPGELVFSYGDAHIYKDHLTDDVVFEQLRRDPYDPPRLVLNKMPSIFIYTLNDIAVEGYNHHPAIKAEISV